MNTRRIWLVGLDSYSLDIYSAHGDCQIFGNSYWGEAIASVYVGMVSKGFKRKLHVGHHKDLPFARKLRVVGHHKDLPFAGKLRVDGHHDS